MAADTTVDWAKPSMNRGEANNRVSAGPQANQRLSRRAAQSIPNPPNNMPQGMVLPATMDNTVPVSASPRWKLRARNWPKN